ncbi:18456_t:CDS:10 [Acaulospora morrowiae]|uniref:18456_t:CDS:1 n=1 Tax=Acaulospora morrowiae TaxID=94023 RepID=A0A9N8WNK4_9GLOM|nr:18456_t:CDS:10 [Acaulospora morrowiae]
MNFLFGISSLFFLFFIRDTSSFTVSGRAGHSAALYEKKIYFQGGKSYNVSSSNDFFYLDISKSFDITNPSSVPWVNLLFPNQPSRSYASSCVAGKGVYVFGDSDNTLPAVVQFDLSDQSWKTPTVNELATYNSSSLAYQQCLTSGDGTIYMINGYARNVITFDTVNLNWREDTFSKTPNVKRQNNVILSDGTILFLGGEFNGDRYGYVLYKSIWTYSTKSKRWNMVNTTNELTYFCTPTATTLLPDGRVIIFGCFQSDIPSGIVVIDTRNNYEFFIPTVSNQGPPFTLMDFTATSTGKYILIAFGKDSNTNEYSSNIYLLDVSQRSNFVWTTYFDSEIGSNTNGAPIGLIIGLIIGIIFIVMLARYLYKRCRDYVNLDNLGPRLPNLYSKVHAIINENRRPEALVCLFCCRLNCDSVVHFGTHYVSINLATQNCWCHFCNIEVTTENHLIRSARYIMLGVHHMFVEENEQELPDDDNVQHCPNCGTVNELPVNFPWPCVFCPFCGTDYHWETRRIINLRNYHEPANVIAERIDIFNVKRCPNCNSRNGRDNAIRSNGVYCPVCGTNYNWMNLHIYHLRNNHLANVRDMNEAIIYPIIRVGFCIQTGHRDMALN